MQDSINQEDEVVVQMDSVKLICTLCGDVIKETSFYLHWRNCKYFENSNIWKERQ